MKNNSREFTLNIWNDMSKEDQNNYSGFEDFYMWYYNAIDDED